jgi:hypothetical protein
MREARRAGQRDDAAVSTNGWLKRPTRKTSLRVGSWSLLFVFFVDLFLSFLVVLVELVYVVFIAWSIRDSLFIGAGLSSPRVPWSSQVGLNAFLLSPVVTRF